MEHRTTSRNPPVNSFLTRIYVDLCEFLTSKEPFRLPLQPKALNGSPLWGDILFLLKRIINEPLSKVPAHPKTGFTRMERRDDDQEADDHTCALERRLRGEGRAVQQALTLPSLLCGCRIAPTPAAAPFFRECQCS
jgi:hypothetical protein